jgi:hypothetical protein
MSRRLPKCAAGVLRRPALKLADGDESLAASTDKTKIRCNVGIEEVRADTDCRRSLRWRQCDPGDRGGELPRHAVPSPCIYLASFPHHWQDAFPDSSDTHPLEPAADLSLRPAPRRIARPPPFLITRPIHSPFSAPCLLTPRTLALPRRPQPLRLVGLPDCAADHVHITSCVCVVSCGQRALLALRGEAAADGESGVLSAAPRGTSTAFFALASSRRHTKRLADLLA